MHTALVPRSGLRLPAAEHYARNLIDGRWQFPAAPYDFEIRSPLDSTVIATVPLSSRFDLAAACRSAEGAGLGLWASPEFRMPVLSTVVDRLAEGLEDLAHLQSIETGLDLDDSRTVAVFALDVARSLMSGAVTPAAVTPAAVHPSGVSGHILSWGAPLVEVVTSVLPALLRGDTVVVKPSLRAPLSPVAFALLATDAGLPDGVLNLVQGTGGDVGAALLSRRDLSALHVRAGERTIAQAGRAHDRTGVPLRVVRGGGNALVVGPDISGDPATAIETIAEKVAPSVRVHNAGGPLALPLLVVHSDHAYQVLEAVCRRLADMVGAPLPTEPLRRQALDRVQTLVDDGAQALLGGPGFPDDVTHRMSWRLPPTVLLLGEVDSAAVRTEQATAPLGPVLAVVTWTRPEQLHGLFTAPRARHGVAALWGVEDVAAARLPHGGVVAGTASRQSTAAHLTSAWTGGAL
jgi:acyl-CoA reductase-like NAD-dependent aldehyde dehydrogenase